MRVFLSIIILLSFGCQQPPGHTVQLLKTKYSEKVFNYFYEVALHSEVGTNNRFNLQKWEKDIYIFVGGDCIPSDCTSVRNVINKLNALNIPINVYETSLTEKANLVVTFEPYKKTDTERLNGTGTFYAAKGIIYKAWVKIFYDSAKSIDERVRSHTIFEEITQCLGLPGDSYAYPESMFYQDINYVQGLSELDKQLIHLLYEPAMVPNYSLSKYEIDFADILYNINGTEKFIRFLKDQKVSSATLSNIHKYGIIKDAKDGVEKVSKYHYPTHIVLKGVYPPEFRDILTKAIVDINAISENLKLILIPKDSLVHDGGIHFNFLKDSQMKNDSVYWASKHLGGLLFPRNSRNDIIFKYRDHDKLLENVRKAIPNMLYKSVCLSTAEGIDFYDYNNTAFQLKPLYRETLRVYYDNSLPPGFTKKELEEVMNEYKE